MKIEAEYLEDEELYERVIEDGIAVAAQSLDLATANLKTMLAEFPPDSGDFASLPALLMAKAEEGVGIRVLHSAVPSESFLNELRQTGLWKHPNFAMKRCPRVHLKTALVDDRFAYLGTANFTGAGLGAKSALRRNFEAGIWSRSEELIARLGRFFQSIWDGAMCEGCGRAANCPQPLEEPRF